MKSILFTFAVNIPAIISIASAALLAAKERPGWGWFLFVGLLCIQTVKVTGASSGD